MRAPGKLEVGIVAVSHEGKSSNAAVATVRAISVQRLLERVDCNNEDVRALLRRFEVEPDRLTDPYAVLPLGDCVALLENMAELLDRPHLGAELACRFRPADIGPTGLLFSLSATLRAGFERMDRFLPAFQTSTSSGILTAGEDVLWAYRIHDPKIWPRRQDAEYAVMATCELIRNCLTTSWWPKEVHFEHSAPVDPAPLRKLFRAPVMFDQPTNGLLLSRDDVDRKNRTEDCDLLQVLERHLADLLRVEPPASTLVGRVGRLIGLYLGNRPITLEFLAGGLGMSPRSLQRGLAAEGTSLRRLLQDHRATIAAERFDEQNRDMAAIAESLGYSDRAVLSRAYRGWTGRTPGRRRNGIHPR